MGWERPLSEFPGPYLPRPHKPPLAKGEASVQVNFGSKQVDYDPPIGKLICFGKVGFKRYKDTMRKLFKKRMLVKK